MHYLFSMHIQSTLGQKLFSKLFIKNLQISLSHYQTINSQLDENIARQNKKKKNAYIKKNSGCLIQYICCVSIHIYKDVCNVRLFKSQVIKTNKITFHT